MDPNFKSQNESDYLQMINYLISELNKKKKCKYTKSAP